VHSQNNCPPNRDAAYFQVLRQPPVRGGKNPDLSRCHRLRSDHIIGNPGKQLYHEQSVHTVQ